MTLKLILAFVIAFAVSAVVGFFLVPYLKRIKAGQSIKENGPTWHMSKQGTPTMGGLMFIAAIAVVCLSVGFECMAEGEYGHLFCLAFALVFGAIGFLDDYEKLKKKQNLGLTAGKKLLLQLAAAVAFIFLMRRFGYVALDSLYIPFWNKTVPVSEPLYVIFAAFVIVGTVNSVNLTDGVDGLAASTTMPVCIFFAVISMLWGERFLSLGVFASGLAGGLLGFCQVARTLIVEALGLSPNVDFSGILYLAANVPILLLAWQALGRGFLVRTAVCTVTSSLFLSLVPPPAAPLVEEMLTNCVLGGILVGFSLGIVLTCGCSTGGLDILGLWLAKKGKGFSVGRFSLSFNALLYTLCAVLFGLRAAIYSIIYTVFCALFIDRGHQQNITEQVLIFTKDEDPELPRNIMARLGRGVTYWEGKGAYTGEDLRVLCVCVSKFEEADLYGVVHELDPNAFFITQEGVTIHGNFIRKLS